MTLPHWAILQRNALLQDSLRDTPFSFSIMEEYPLVLGDDSTFSHCVIEKNRVIAHANLWPRSLVDDSGRTQGRIGLIGNVATAPDARGRGIMRRLMEDLTEKARNQDLDAVFLWSDLASFYHKLGFVSFGRERRYRFAAEALPPADPLLTAIQSATLSADDLAGFLRMRPRVAITVDRSAAEFRRLLAIPATLLFASYRLGVPVSYLVLGKGADMVGVVHEWGGDSHHVLRGLRSIVETLGWREIMLLCPWDIAAAEVFDKWCMTSEEWPVGLGKGLRRDWNRRAPTYIWGLDSI